MQRMTGITHMNCWRQSLTHMLPKPLLSRQQAFHNVTVMSSQNRVHPSYQEQQTETQTWLNSQSARQTLSLEAVSTNSTILLKFAPELIIDYFTDDEIQAQKNWIHFPRVTHGLLSGGPEADTFFSYSTCTRRYKQVWSTGLEVTMFFPCSTLSAFCFTSKGRAQKESPHTPHCGEGCPSSQVL